PTFLWGSHICRHMLILEMISKPPGHFESGLSDIKCHGILRIKPLMSSLLVTVPLVNFCHSMSVKETTNIMCKIRFLTI
uniref:Uncharacterized protein n=2 Tax=Sus scrofa TaxID=9823 RepID=A0A8D0XLN6_PIG